MLIKPKDSIKSILPNKPLTLCCMLTPKPQAHYTRFLGCLERYFFLFCPFI